MIRPFSFAPAGLAGAYRIWPQRFSDGRGCLCKDYSREIFREAGIDFCPAETFWTESAGGVLRGLHFQRGQDKLVRCVSGRVYDVLADLRPGSATFGRWRAFELSGESGECLYLPDGVAHGYLALERSMVAYSCGAGYDPAREGGVRWDDPGLAVEWPLEGDARPILSERDRALPGLRELCGGAP